MNGITEVEVVGGVVTVTTTETYSIEEEIVLTVAVGERRKSRREVVDA